MSRLAGCSVAGLDGVLRSSATREFSSGERHIRCRAVYTINPTTLAATTPVRLARRPWAQVGTAIATAYAGATMRQAAADVRSVAGMARSSFLGSVATTRRQRPHPATSELAEMASPSAASTVTPDGNTNATTMPARAIAVHS